MQELIFNEQELVQRCIDDDRRAQEFLFNQFYDDFYLIAIRYLGDHHDTEDIVIHAFTRIFKALSSFSYRGPGSLGKWARTVLINEAIRSLKKRKLLQFNDDLRQLDSPAIEANAVQQMQAEDIMQLIEQLPAGYRTVFNLFVIEGYSHKEIGAMIGISENTSKTQLKKARHSLMKNMDESNAYGTL